MLPEAWLQMLLAVQLCCCRRSPRTAAHRRAGGESGDVRYELLVIGFVELLEYLSRLMPLNLLFDNQNNFESHIKSISD